MRTINLLVVASLFLASCSPKVVTEVMNTYPNVMPADSVHVFELGDRVPNSAEMLGRISIKGQGPAHCEYDKILEIAKQETGKIGGNGFVLTRHIWPYKTGVSCHQLNGMMLHLQDMEIDSTAYNPVEKAIAMEGSIEPKKGNRNFTPQTIIEAEIGYGWIFSDLYSPRGDKMSNPGGLEWKLELDHIYGKGVGFGLQYSGFTNSSYEDMMLSYIAPQFVGRMQIRNWALKAGIGIGLGVYKDNEITCCGFGSNCSLGVEYMLTEKIGLGVTFNTLGIRLPKQDNSFLDEDQINGIQRINILGGFRFYF